MPTDLENRITDIARDEIREDNISIEDGMRVFDDQFSLLGVDRERRMQGFIELHERYSKYNTKNLLFVPRVQLPEFPFKYEDIAGHDYYSFFNHAIDSKMDVSIPCLTYRGMIHDIHKPGNNYIVHGEIYLDFMGTREFGRLLWVKQLGTVSYAAFFTSLNHNRFEHSLLTSVINELVLVNGNFDENLINLGIAAGHFHDAAMPPFSDQGRLAAKGILDEEVLVTEVLENSKELRAILNKHDVSEKELVETIQGKGPLRDIINSRGIDTDKIAYVARDFEWARSYLPDSYRRKLYSACPDLFNIFMDIFLDEEGMVFRDPEKVVTFLQVRAMLFKEIYMNPYNRAREAFLERELAKLWGEKLDTDNMLIMADHDFKEVIDKSRNRILQDIFRYTISHHFEEHTRDYDCRKGNLEKYKAAYRGKDWAVRHEKAINPGTGTRVLHKGRIKTIRDVFPERSGWVEKLCSSLEYIGVYRHYNPAKRSHLGRFYDELDERMDRYAAML